MSLESKPMFRKAIYPFYDSQTACIIIIILMLLILIFSIAGISVAREEPQYNGYVWVPVTLAIMSAVILLPATIRLIKHYHARFSH
ncbi:MAG: hypothetical protein R6V76_02025 [Desulfobacterales bacterium]